MSEVETERTVFVAQSLEGGKWLDCFTCGDASTAAKAVDMHRYYTNRARLIKRTESICAIALPQIEMRPCRTGMTEQ